jgi:hypothetical protein
MFRVALAVLVLAIVSGCGSNHSARQTKTTKTSPVVYRLRIVDVDCPLPISKRMTRERVNRWFAACPAWDKKWP